MQCSAYDKFITVRQFIDILKGQKTACNYTAQFYMDNFKIYETQIKDLVTTVCSSDTNSYQYGLMGMLKDNSFYGEGNAYDFGARMYDPRIGRWMSVDVIKQPSLSPYNAFANCPILFLDPDGKTQVVGTDGSILYQDDKNPGTVYLYTGTTPLNFTHFSTEEMQKLGGSTNFTQLTSGRVREDGKVEVMVVCTNDQLVDYVNSVKDHADIEENFKNNQDFIIAPEQNSKGGLETVNMDATHYGVKVKPPSETEFLIHVAEGYSTSNWLFGNVYDLQNSIEHEDVHREWAATLYEIIGANVEANDDDVKNISYDQIGEFSDGYGEFIDSYDFHHRSELDAYKKQQNKESYSKTSADHKRIVKAQEAEEQRQTDSRR